MKTKLTQWLEATDEAWQKYLKEKEQLGEEKAYRIFHHRI